LTNLNVVTGNNIVGGIVGEATHTLWLCVNTDSVIGGNIVGGVAGKIVGSFDCKYIKNSGVILGRGSTDLHNIGGIAGQIEGNFQPYSILHGSTNIGIVRGNNYDNAGGIAGFISRTLLLESVNAGIIDGGRFSVGGIVGRADLSSAVQCCINTNWIQPFVSTYSGAIIGYSTDPAMNCYFDEQMTIVNGIGNGHSGAIGLQTIDMLGNLLFDSLCSV